MKQNNNISILKSNFQLLSAIEYSLVREVNLNIYYFGIPSFEIFDLIKLINKTNNIKIGLIFFGRSYYIPIFFLLFKFLFIRLFKSQINNLLIGDERVFEFLVINKIINSKKTIILDDGISSLYSRYLISNSEQYQFQEESFKKKISYKFKLNPHKISYFTCFESSLDESNLYDYNYHSFQNLISSYKNKTIRTNFKAEVGNLYFIGQPLSEIKIVSEEYELNKIVSLNFHLNEINKKITYIAHPRDSNKKIMQIKSLGISVLQFDIMIEIMVLKGEITPDTIYGFYSSALLTLPLLIPSIKVEILNLDKEEINLIYRDEVLQSQISIRENILL